MTTIVVTQDYLGRSAFTFSYDPTVVDIIKQIIPGCHRQWSSAEKTWTVSSVDHALRFIDMTKALGHTVIGEELLRPAWEAQPQPAITLATPDDVFDRLLHIVGAEREDKIFSALTRVLHPDRTTGSHELMTALNRVRDQRAGRNCRPGTAASGHGR